MKGVMAGSALAGAVRKARVSQYPNNCLAQLAGRTAREEIQGNAMSNE